MSPEQRSIPAGATVQLMWVKILIIWLSEASNLHIRLHLTPFTLKDYLKIIWKWSEKIIWKWWQISRCSGVIIILNRGKRDETHGTKREEESLLLSLKWCYIKVFLQRPTEVWHWDGECPVPDPAPRRLEQASPASSSQPEAHSTVVSSYTTWRNPVQSSRRPCCNQTPPLPTCSPQTSLLCRFRGGGGCTDFSLV